MDLISAAKLIYTIRLANGMILLKDDKLGLKPNGAKVDVAEIKANEIAIKHLLKLNADNKDPILKIYPSLAKSGYQLSSIQQSIFAHCTKLDDSSVYNVPLVIEYKSELNQEQLEKIQQVILATYPILRTRINSNLELSFFEINDFNLTVNKISRDKLEQWIEDSGMEELPILNSNLIKFRVAICDEVTYLSLNHHHIIEDILFINLIKHTALNIKFDEDLTEIIKQAESKVHYYDYAVYEQVKKELINPSAYYDLIREKLEQSPDKSLIALDTRVPMVDGRSVKFEINETLTLNIKKACSELGVTEFNLLTVAYAITLSKYLSTEDIFISTTISVRNMQLMDVAGPLINVLPLVFSCPSAEVVNTCLTNHQQKLNQVIDLSTLAFDDVLAQIKEDKRQLLQDFAFTMHNIPSRNEGFEEQHIFNKFHNLKVKYPLSLTIAGLARKYIVNFEFSLKYFSDKMANEFFNGFTNILNQIATGYTKKQTISQIKLLSETMQDMVLNTLNGVTDSSVPKTTLVKLFEDQVVRTPDNIAVIYNDQQLTYTELNQKANQLARSLASSYRNKYNQDILPDTKIGICITRNIDMLVAMLGILKTGAAYVPIDPSYPIDRIEYIIIDADLGMLVTDSLVAINQNFNKKDIFLIDKENYSINDINNVVTSISPANLAYVIYTSGTTGMPKGVMIEHRTVINFLHGMKSYIGKNGTWLTVTNITFDISVLEIFGSLINGYKLIINPPIGLSLQNDSLINQHKPMGFGLFYFGNHNADGKDAAISKYDLLLSGAKFADSNEFTSVWTPERHFGAFGGLYPNPVVTSAAISTITKNVKIRTGSCVLPLHHPIRVAEDWSVIDNLSNGRVELSFATGWNKNDFTLAPDNFEGRKDVLLDNLAIVRKLWAGEKVAFNGVGGAPIQIGTLPRPIQKELPVWMTVGFNPESFRQAGEQGAHILTHLLGQSPEELAKRLKIYHEGLESKGYDKTKFKVALMLHTFVTHSEEYAISQVKDPFKRYLSSSVDLLRQLKSDGFDTLTKEERNELLEHAFQRYYYSSGLFGTPKSCLKMIDKLKGIGVTEIASLIDFGIQENIVLDNLIHLNELRLLSAAKTNEVNTLSTDLIAKHQVTHLQCTPSLAKIIFNQEADKKLDSLTTVLIGGEAMPVNLMHQIHQEMSVKLFNMYGPTEATIWATLADLTLGTKIINIGKALPNIKLYVLNQNLEPCPYGMVGQLYIGGNCLARGYLNRPDLTSEKFINNPFSNAGDKIYHTGDLVRILDNGSLEYIGRNDFQVKVNGHRIEVGEIEHSLALHPDVSQAVVSIKQHITDMGTIPHIIAYYVAKNHIAEDDLLSFLGKKLPEYMLPSIFIHIDKVPLTVNGKTDYKALPKANFVAETHNWIGPRNDIEKSLCDLWSSLLKQSNIGINDNFFKNGGNSILAIQAAHKMSVILNTTVSLANLFVYKTIEKIVQNVVGNEIISIPVTENIIAPLSFSQERLWFIHQFEEHKYAYNHPFVLNLLPETNIERFKKALEILVNRHRIFKTVIVESDTEDFAQEVKDIPMSLIESDILQSQLNEKILAAVNYSFDLENEAPFKVWSFKVKDSQIQNVVVINVHHIAVDGWSLKIVFDELVKLYENLDVVLPQLPVQYTDFARWQRNYLSKDILTKQQNYWQSTLANFTPLELPLDYSRPSQLDYKGADFSFTLDKALSQKLRQIARSESVTLYTLLLAGFNLLLSEYSNQKDIVIGTPVANRHYQGVENLVGFFVNTLVIRNKVNPLATLKDFIMDVNNNLLQAQINQDYPFEKLVANLGVPQDMSRHPIFQVVFGVQAGGINSDSSQIFKFDDLYQYFKVSKFDLTMFIDDSNEELICNTNYATSLFDFTTIELMVKRFEIILTSLVERLNFTVDQVTFLTEQDAKLLLLDLNKTREIEDLSIAKAFDVQVKLNPNKTALIYGNKKLSYIDLDTKANVLAKRIREKFSSRNHELNADDLIGIYLSRDIEMIVSILAIIKAGAAYLPLDPKDPKERTTFILNDSKSQLVITRKAKFDLTDIDIATLFIEELPNNTDRNNEFVSNSEPSNLAYVIYTSGTTGQPKGVMIEQCSVVALTKNTKELQINSEHVFAQLGNTVFDASVFEIWGALLNGATLVIPENSNELMGNVDLFKQFLVNNNISVLWLTRTLFDNIYLLNNDIFENLQYLLVGGEALTKDLIVKLLQQEARPKNILNGYGPTESTVFTTFYNCDKGISSTVPIGLPIDNRQVYVLNKEKQPVGVGVVGELYIGGAGLARGYLNNPQLTSDKFITNHTLQIGDVKIVCQKLYRSGDLVRQRIDGVLEYIGRNDFQVKIRGYRIELQEIQNRILAYPEGIRQSVVLALDRLDGENAGEKYLQAYYSGPSEYSDEALYQYMAQSLPDYMIPKGFIYLESFPTTVNGKLDSRALALIKPKKADIEIAKPSSAMEQHIYQVWHDVLGIDNFGIDDDFFKIGGDSILSIQVSSKLRKAGINCSVRDIFMSKTIRQLITTLEDIKSTNEIISEQGNLHGEFELLPIQKWFFDLDLKTPSHWNQAFIIKTEKLNRDLLPGVLEKLIQQHDALRLVFNNGKQTYLSVIPTPHIHYLDVSNMNADEINQALTNIQNNFSLEAGPLWSVAYMDGYSDGSARLLFACHHLIIDAVSWRIIIEDLRDLYLGNTLGRKSTSYRQWAEVNQEYSNKPIAAEIRYWENLMTNSHECYSSVATLPDFKTMDFMLDETNTNDLLYHTNSVFNTEINDILLTVFAYSINSLTQRKLNWITLEGHGRELIQKDIDLNNTVGWFTSMFPVELPIKDSIGETIVAIKDNLRLIPNKGIGFGIHRAYGNNLQLQDELPPIGFNYFGQFDVRDENSWHIVMEDTGVIMTDQHVHNKVNLDSAVIGKRLTFRMTSNLVAQDELKDSIMHNLRQVIQYCVNLNNNKKKIYTSSDYSYDVGYEPLVHLNPNETEKPILIMVHPGASGAEAYINTICRNLTNTYRVIIINNYQRYSGNNIFPETIAEIADLYLYLLNKYQVPLENYSIYGLSFGAIVAYEMLARLEKYGNPAPKEVFLIDPIFLNWLDFESTEQEKELKTAYPGHAAYMPSTISSNQKFNLVKCTQLSKFNLKDKHYTNMVNLICKTPYCGLNPQNNQINLYQIGCDHDQTLDEPFAEQIANFMVNVQNQNLKA